MGAQMTKELGLYNEEEKVCTPVGSQKYRLLDDPRSVTAGISRTPIQVDCTPTGVKNVITRENILKAECSFTEHTDIPGEIDSNSCYEEEKDEESIAVEDDEITKPQTRYLETDIDNLDLSSTNESTTQPLMKTDDKPKVLLCDVRSPSFEIARTPVLVECTPELFALHSRIDSISFCDFDVHVEDPSIIVSDDEQASQHNHSSINKWLVSVDNKPVSGTPLNNSFAESPKKVAQKQKELNALKKQLFFTPDVKEIAKPKARTPLGDVQASQMRDSPLKLVRNKQWRNIQEERQRLGILDIENTPPNLSLPPLSKISSAPGKMLDRKPTKINWDEQNVMLI